MSNVIARLRSKGRGRNRVVDFARELVKETGDDDLGGLAAELAYRFLLALFPFFIFLAALGAFLAPLFGIQDPTQRIIESLQGALPGETAALVADQIARVLATKNPGLLTVGFLGAMWAAAGGMLAIMKAINRAYDLIETRPFWGQYLIALGLTILAGSFILGASALLVVGQLFLGQIARTMGLSRAMVMVAATARLTVAVAMIVVASAFLYWAAPNTRLPFRWISPGSMLFTVAWLAITYVFAFYVSNFGSYNATYGALGGVVVLLIWFYLTSFIFLEGAEINAMVYKRAEGRHPEPPDRRQRPGLPIR